MHDTKGRNIRSTACSKIRIRARAAGLRLRAGPPAVGQSARGVWPRAEARVALKGLPGGRGAGCGSGRGRQGNVFLLRSPDFGARSSLQKIGSRTQNVSGQDFPADIAQKSKIYWKARFSVFGVHMGIPR